MTKKSAPPANTSPWVTAYDPVRRRWMWAGVICFTAVIAGLWGWSLKQRMLWFNFKQTPESQIAAQAKADWKKTFEKRDSEENKEEIKKQLQAAVAQILSASSTAKNK